MGKGDPEGGRPRVEIDIDQLRNLVRIQCTAEECASVLNCSADTLDRRLKEEGFDGFADFYKRHSSEGKASLRRAQWKAAQDGNPTMLIWLGKQMLAQRDKHEYAGPDGGPIPVEIKRTIVDPKDG